MFDETASFQWSRWAFLKALAAIYLAAFASLWLQVGGLYGAEGILPYADLMTAAGAQLEGAERWMKLPTLLWLDSSDAAIHGLCAAGVLAAAAALAGLAPPVSLALCWVAYLSLVTPGRTFLSFQWDALLLETGLLAIFLAPWGLRPGLGARPATRASMALLWWLLFRLMFWSGAVKLASGDAAWRTLTALEYHYWTQPLPHWVAWHADKWPVGIHRFSVAITYVIELVLPFFIFYRRPFRHAAAAGFAFLMALILATGNYGFFNWLALALCLLLLDDAALLRLVPSRWRPAPDHLPLTRSWREWLVLPVALLTLSVSATRLQSRVAGPESLAEPQAELYRAVQPLRSFNSYGLFAVMTTERREIAIEGSLDGREWRPYVLPWQPGPVDRRPGVVPLHMPRLDWQMWFAALGTAERNPWIRALMGRLLEGSPEVLGLFERDPFDGQPPKYVRAVIRDYTFSDDWTRSSTGAWWVVGEPTIYAGPIEKR